MIRPSAGVSVEVGDLAMVHKSDSTLHQDGKGGNYGTNGTVDFGR